jgi:hypothetical protein
MGLEWKGGDAARRSMAAADLRRSGLSAKANDALFDVGVFNLEELLKQPWSDEDAGQKFVALRWRLSVSPTCTPKLLNQIEAVRSRQLELI